MNHLAKVPDNLDSQNMCCCLMSFLHTFVDLFAEQQKKKQSINLSRIFFNKFQSNILLDDAAYKHNKPLVA